MVNKGYSDMREHIYSSAGYLTFDDKTGIKHRVKYKNPIFVKDIKEFKRKRSKNGTRFVDLKQLIKITIK